MTSITLLGAESKGILLGFMRGEGPAMKKLPSAASRGEQTVGD